jgi:serine/threonine-protein kinase
LSVLKSEGHSPNEGLTGQVLLGRYEVGPCVARGGFASVHRGRHRELDIPVAIKVLAEPEGRSEEARAAWLSLFRQEAKTIAALNHPAIVRVLDFGVATQGATERPWMVMDWLEGATLEHEMRSRGGVGRSPREALELLRPAFDALACAHDAGVCHRDIKPSNLMMVKPTRGAPALRVIDFGIAKVDSDGDPGSGATGTRSSLVAFSLAYAAPEQVTHTRTGPWTDVHALALVLTEALTGERPYGDATGHDLVEAALRDARPTPARAGVAVGPWEPVLARALARLPSARPQRASDLWSELAARVDEAQAAWASQATGSHAARPGFGHAETVVSTLDEGSAPAAPVVRRPTRALAAVALAAVVVAALAFAARREPVTARAEPAPAQRDTAPAQRVAVPAAPVEAPPAPVEAPPAIARTPVEPRRVVVSAPAKTPPRRAPRRAVAPAAPAVAEPGLVVE